MTTIQIQTDTKKNLARFKDNERETFDEVLKRLMKIAATVEKEVRAHHWRGALLSEKILAKDWLSKEDEEAWKDL